MRQERGVSVESVEFFLHFDGGEGLEEEGAVEAGGGGYFVAGGVVRDV